jgi:phage anti-repressor protein
MIETLVRIEKVELGGKLVDAVDARDLHDFLELRQPWQLWLALQIQQRLRLVEGK